MNTETHEFIVGLLIVLVGFIGTLVLTLIVIKAIT